MGKKSAPPAPDYTAAAQATAQSNLQAAQQQTAANRPTQITPWGTSAWSKGPDDAWTQNISLSPQEQQALNDQMGIQSGKSGLAQGMMGRLGEATAQPFDWSNMTSMGGVPQAGGLQATSTQPGQPLQAGNLDATGDMGRQRIEQQLFQRMAQPHAQQQSALDTQLAGMGLQRGSEAWGREQQRLGDQQSREMYDAMQTAGTEQSRQFGMAQQAGAQNFGQQAQAGAQNFGQQLQSNAQNFGQQQSMLGQNFGQQMQSANYQNQLRQQQIQEQQLQRSLPLNELNALLTGSQVAQPSFGGFSQQGNAGGVDYSGAAQQQYGAGVAGYNAGQQQSQGLMQGLGTAAGIAAMFMSDRRLKFNVVRIGTHPIGVGVYEYDIFGERRRGVMAQELLLVAPGRVLRHPTGYLMVNYEGL